MKKIVIMLGLLIALGLAAAGPCPVYAADDEGAPAAKADAPKDAAKDGEKKDEDGKTKDKKDKDVSGGRFSGDPVYVHLDPMVLPVITNDGAEQLVTLQIAIEVKDFSVADTVHANMPLVQDALMRALYGGLGEGSLRDGQLVDVVKIKAKATAALDDVIGADSIRNVLIEAVAQRML